MLEHRESDDGRRGDNIFGQGSRAPVAITLLVRCPKATGGRCRILYRDIGDYLTREEKLNILRDAGSIAGVTDWRENHSEPSPRLDRAARTKRSRASWQ